MIRNQIVPGPGTNLFTDLSPDRSTLVPLVLMLFVLFGGIFVYADATPSRIVPPSPASGPGQAVESPER